MATPGEMLARSLRLVKDGEFSLPVVDFDVIGLAAAPLSLSAAGRGRMRPGLNEWVTVTCDGSRGHLSSQ